MVLEHILVPTDFSELSRRAVPIARALANMTGAAVHLLHVVQLVEIALEVPEAGILRRKVPADCAELERRLAELGDAEFGRAGVPFVTAIRNGDPARAIAKYAREIGADRIIIGTHGDGVLRQLFRGSVSKTVLEHAPCPVVMVPPPIEKRSPRADEAGIPAAAIAT